MNQLYIPSANPKYDPFVLSIQRELNQLRSSLLHNLPFIKEDGYYGFETAKAIRAFQQTCNIRADGVYGPQTRNCILQKLREMPSIGPMSVQPKKIVSSSFSWYDVVDQLISSVLDFNSTIKTVATNVTKLKNPTPELVFKCFRGSLEKIDPSLKTLRESIDKYNLFKKNSTVSPEIRNTARRYQGGARMGYAQRNSIIQAQQAVSKANANARIASHYLDKANDTKNIILNNIKKYDFTSKISSKLKTMFPTNKIDLSKIPIKGNIVGIGFIFSLKDIIRDIFHIGDLFDESKSEVWKKDLQKDCYAFLDGLIIGCISLFLAQLVVVGGATLAGLTISTGPITVAIIVISLIISLIIAYLFSSKDFSFSKFIFEDCAEFIISKIYKLAM